MYPNKEKFVSAVSNIEKKISLPEFADKLRSLSLPASSSWTKTISTLKEVSEYHDLDPKTIANLDLIVNWIDEYLSFHAKTIFTFPLKKKQHPPLDNIYSAFIDNLKNSFVKTTYPKKFPYLLSKEELQQYNNTTTLREIRKNSTHIDCIFSQVKEYKTRNEINITQNDAEAVEKLKGYSKIIGVKTVSHEHIDIVRFDLKQNSIELHLDITRPGKSILNLIEIENRQKSYKDIINASVVAKIPSFYIPAALNLFKTIQKIYDSHQGNVCELGFVTTAGGSVKKEKMKRYDVDLRSETWHAGGMNAVTTGPVPDKVEMYQLSVCWKISNSSDMPILSIPGTYRSLTSAEVEHAIILGCKEKASYDFALSQLQHFANLP